MIVVTGASGALGRLVVDQLLTRVPAQEVVAAVRNPASVADLAERGVTVRHADYDDAATLGPAFAGADRLLLISSSELDPARRIPQHLVAIEAARDAGVGAIAYTSALHADTSAAGLLEAHHATERAIVDSGLPYTLLRHPYYSELYLNPGLAAAVEAGELTSATGGRGLNTLTRDDLAAVAATVLTTEGHANRGYDLTGPLWTFPELAAALGVSYREVEPVDGPFAWLDGLIRDGALEYQTGDVAAVLGRPGAPLADVVATALKG